MKKWKSNSIVILYTKEYVNWEHYGSAVCYSVWKIEAIEFGWLFSYLSMFQTSTFKRPKEPLIIMILIVWNLGYLRCPLLSQCQVPPVLSSPLRQLAFLSQRKVKMRLRSVLLGYCSKIINELIVASIKKDCYLS